MSTETVLHSLERLNVDRPTYGDHTRKVVETYRLRATRREVNTGSSIWRVQTPAIDNVDVYVVPRNQLPFAFDS